MTSLLAAGEPIDAVFAAGDEMAVGAIQAIRDRGLRVPEDIAVVGFDNSPHAAVGEVPLTTVAHPCAEIGQELVRALSRAMKGEPPISQLITPSLVVRSSA